MKNISAISAISLAIALSATPAMAQDGDDTGFYVAVTAGAAALKDPSVTYYDAGGTFGGTGTTDTAAGVIDARSAFAITGAVGYDFGLIRTDLEVAYARHKNASLTVTAINGAATTLTSTERADVCAFLEAATCGGSDNTFTIDGSRTRQLSAMANAWVDLPVGGMVVPYVGGGLGVSGFEVDGDGKAKFAWQLGAGAALNVTRNIAVTVDYRHREVGAATVAYDATSGLNVGKLKTDTFGAGLRIGF